MSGNPPHFDRSIPSTLNVRHDIRNRFSRESWLTDAAFVATAAVAALLAIIVEVVVLHGFFTTTDLASGQWLACAAVGSSI